MKIFFGFGVRRVYIFDFGILIRFGFRGKNVGSWLFRFYIWF